MGLLRIYTLCSSIKLAGSQIMQAYKNNSFMQKYIMNWEIVQGFSERKQVRNVMCKETETGREMTLPLNGKNTTTLTSEKSSWRKQVFSICCKQKYLSKGQDNYLNVIFDQDEYFLLYKPSHNLNLMQNMEINLSNMIM